MEPGNIALFPQGGGDSEMFFRVTIGGQRTSREDSRETPGDESSICQGLFGFIQTGTTSCEPMTLVIEEVFRTVSVRLGTDGTLIKSSFFAEY